MVGQELDGGRAQDASPVEKASRESEDEAMLEEPVFVRRSVKEGKKRLVPVPTEDTGFGASDLDGDATPAGGVTTRRGMRSVTLTERESQTTSHRWSKVLTKPRAALQDCEAAPCPTSRPSTSAAETRAPSRSLLSLR